MQMLGYQVNRLGIEERNDSALFNVGEQSNFLARAFVDFYRTTAQ